MANKHMKRCSTSLATRDMQIKVVVSLSYLLDSQNGHNTKCWITHIIKRDSHCKEWIVPPSNLYTEVSTPTPQTVTRFFAGKVFEELFELIWVSPSSNTADVVKEDVSQRWEPPRERLWGPKREGKPRRKASGETKLLKLWSLTSSL